MLKTGTRVKILQGWGFKRWHNGIESFTRSDGTVEGRIKQMDGGNHAYIQTDSGDVLHARTQSLEIIEETAAAG